MAVLVVLVVAFAITLLIQCLVYRSVDVVLSGRISVSSMFVFAGVSHFLLAEGMVQMLPEWVPLRYPLVYGTGLMELGFGIGFLWCRYARLIGLLAIAFLICVLPSNIYAALTAVDFGGNVHGSRYLLFVSGAAATVFDCLDVVYVCARVEQLGWNSG